MKTTCLSLALAFSPLALAATFTASDVAAHATGDDCWVSIERKVYDITRYVDEHPAPPRILIDSCGKDATAGWLTKGKDGRPHSKKAAALLKKFLKGDLEAASK